MATLNFYKQISKLLIHVLLSLVNLDGNFKFLQNKSLNPNGLEICFIP